MTREKFFRGKRTDNGEWVEGFYFNNGKKAFISAFPYHANYVVFKIMYEVDPATVGQFTGLIDKNGKKIFEGDIIKVPNWNCYGVVRYNVPVCAFFIEMTDGDFVSMYDFASDVEVIGNIHDNPRDVHKR